MRGGPLALCSPRFIYTIIYLVESLVIYMNLLGLKTRLYLIYRFFSIFLISHLSIYLSKPMSLHCRRKAASSPFHLLLSCACRVNVTHPNSLMSTIQRLLCLPPRLVCVIGVPLVILCVHLLFLRLARWPAHLNFFVFISCMISLTFVFFIISPDF